MLNYELYCSFKKKKTFFFLILGNLNYGPYLPHPTSIYTCEVTTTQQFIDLHVHIYCGYVYFLNKCV